MFGESNPPVWEWSLRGDLITEHPSTDSLILVNKLSRSEFVEHITGKYVTLRGKIYTLTSDKPDISKVSKNRPVRQISRAGELIKVHRSAVEAAKEVGCTSDHITRALGRYSGGVNRAVGFIWAYDDGSEVIRDLEDKMSKQLIAFDKEGKFVKQYLSLLEFCRVHGVSNHVPYKLLKTGGIHDKLNIGLRYRKQNEPAI